MSNSKKNAVLYPDNKNGIYLYEYPMINGIRQYVQIRGTDRKNPLILFLHGGPGGSVAGLCHILQAGWEEKFTVANWDQRNTCKTYFANKDKSKEIAKTGTMEDFIKDIDKVIAYLHTVYDFEKLILMGFSWGSAIGSEYAKRHPENLICYIGVGQHISYADGLHFVCDKLSKFAKGNEKDSSRIKAFEASIPAEPKMTKKFMANIQSFIALGTKYISKSGKPFPIKALLTSPFLNFREKISMIKTDFKLLEGALTTMMTYDFRENMSYKIPVLFIFGEEDFSCPIGMLDVCFDSISAPEKQLEIIPKAAHSCFFDQPDIFNQKITSFLNTINLQYYSNPDFVTFSGNNANTLTAVKPS